MVIIVNKVIKLICLSFFLSGSLHAMNNNEHENLGSWFVSSLNESATAFARELIVAIKQATGTDINNQLIEAAKSGDHKRLKLLMAKDAEIDYADQNYETSLIWAAKHGHQECCRLLIDAQAEINCRNRQWQSALLWAANNGHQECIRMLIDAGAQINARDLEGYTALIVAAQHGNQECVHVLIDAKAQIHDSTNYGAIALSMASDYGHLQVCKLLIGAVLVPKEQRDALIAFLGCGRKQLKSLLNEWKVPKDVMRLLGKHILMASKQANKPTAIKEIENLKYTCKNRQYLWDHVINQ